MAEVLMDIARNAGCENQLVNIIVKLLNFDQLVAKQEECQHLFDLVSFLLDRKNPEYFSESIKKLIRDIRRYNIT